MSFFLTFCLILSCLIGYVNYEDAQHYKNKEMLIYFYENSYEDDKLQCTKLCKVYDMEFHQLHYIKSHAMTFNKTTCSCSSDEDIGPGLTKVYTKEISLD